MLHAAFGSVVVAARATDIDYLSSSNIVDVLMMCLTIVLEMMLLMPISFTTPLCFISFILSSTFDNVSH